MVTQGVSFLFASIVLFFLTTLFYFVELKTSARMERRIGANKTDRFGLLQFFADFGKHLAKKRRFQNEISIPVSFLFLVNIAVPFFFFYLVLFCLHGGDKILVGIFLIIIAAVLDYLMVYSITDSAKISKIKRYLLVMISCLILLSLSFTPVPYMRDLIAMNSTNIGSLGATAMIIISQPFIFLLAAVSFVSLIFFKNNSSIIDNDMDFFSGFRGWLYGFSKKSWMVCLLLFWGTTFFNIDNSGGTLLYGLLLFPLMLVLQMILMLTGATLTRMRLSDSLNLLVSRMIPLAVLLILLQSVWMVLTA